MSKKSGKKLPALQKPNNLTFPVINDREKQQILKFLSMNLMVKACCIHAHPCTNSSNRLGCEQKGIAICVKQRYIEIGILCDLAPPMGWSSDCIKWAQIPENQSYHLVNVSTEHCNSDYFWNIAWMFNYGYLQILKQQNYLYMWSNIVLLMVYNVVLLFGQVMLHQLLENTQYLQYPLH